MAEFHNTNFDFHGNASLQQSETAHQLLEAITRLERCIDAAASMPLASVGYYLPDLRAIHNLLVYGDERGFIAGEKRE